MLYILYDYVYCVDGARWVTLIFRYVCIVSENVLFFMERLFSDLHYRSDESTENLRTYFLNFPTKNIGFQSPFMATRTKIF